IPDVLAAAIVFVEPSSPVDAWARGEDAQPADDDDDFREVVLHDREAERRADDGGSAHERAERDATEVASAETASVDLASVETDPAGNALLEEDDGPGTLRPSEVPLPPYGASRRGAVRRIAVAVSVAAVGGL